MKKSLLSALVVCTITWFGAPIAAGDAPEKGRDRVAFKSCDGGTTKIFEDRSSLGLMTLVLPKSGNRYSAHIEPDGDVVYMAFQAARSTKIEFLAREIWMKKLLDESPAYYKNYHGKESDCTVDRSR